MHSLPLFILAGIVLNLTPGPDMAFFGSRAASQGFKSGFAAFMGICTGCLVHTVAAALGLSALLLTSASAFMVVKIVGAAYLVYVGVSILRDAFRSSAASGILVDATLLHRSHRSVFMQGLLTNVLNPKVALFFLAFLPQFVVTVGTSSADQAWAVFGLGVIFVINSVLVCAPLVWVFARFGAALRGNESLTNWINRSCGALFVAVGVKLAFTEKPA